MAKHVIKLFSPSASRTIQVFPYQTLWQYSDGTNAEGMKKSRFLTNVSLYLGND